jgi:hypothetical protein
MPYVNPSPIFMYNCPFICGFLLLSKDKEHDRWMIAVVINGFRVTGEGYSFVA